MSNEKKTKDLSELSIEQLREKLAEEQAARAAAEAKVKKLTGERNVAVAELAESAITGKVPVQKVKGKLTIELDTPEGKVTKTIRVADGRVKMRLLTGEIVPSEATLRIGNGGKATDEELAAYPALSTLSKEQVVATFTEYAAMEASIIVIEDDGKAA